MTAFLWVALVVVLTVLGIILVIFRKQLKEFFTQENFH